MSIVTLDQVVIAATNDRIGPLYSTNTEVQQLNLGMLQTISRLGCRCTHGISRSSHFFGRYTKSILQCRDVRNPLSQAEFQHDVLTCWFGNTVQEGL